MAIVLVDAFPEAIEAGRLLAERQLTLATAESCTGGLLAAALTAVAGSSAHMRGGVVAYSNEVKVALLGVDPAILASEGAVSEAVARAMASGVRRRLGSDLGVGITGIAGPGADGSAKPVGLIWLGLAGPGEEVISLRLLDDHGREANREGAVRAALGMLLNHLSQVG